MDTIKLKEQVEVIRETFGYINRFKDKTFVIKLDDSLSSHALYPLLIRDIVHLHQAGIRIVLVPGAKTRIDEILATYKIPCKTVGGVRVSTAQAIPFIKMAAFDVSNKIMTMLAENNTCAVVGNWVQARGIGVHDGVDFQHSGLVEKVKTSVLQSVLEQHLVPIFPNIGWSGVGKPYNISSNDLAFTISVELQAAKLFYITNTPGITADLYKVPEGIYASTDGVISQLRVDEAESFLKLNAGKEYDQSLELLNLGVRACKSGVDRVHIIDGRIEGVLLKEIFSNRGLGTMVYANQHDNIRPMTFADVAEVLRIMQPLVQNQTLVPRSAEEIEKSIGEFAVYEVDGTIHGCAALHTFPDASGEIHALAVDDMYASLGIGAKLVSYFVDRAKKERLGRVFVLTTQAADWFLEAGFRQADISALPKEKRAVYNTRRNSLILAQRLTKKRVRGGTRVE